MKFTLSTSDDYPESDASQNAVGIFVYGTSDELEKTVPLIKQCLKDIVDYENSFTESKEQDENYK